MRPPVVSIPATGVVRPADTLEDPMPAQNRLFHVAPSHVYVSCHWTYEGWYASVTTSAATPDVSEHQRATYGPLSASELLDAIEGHVGALLLG